MKQSKKRGFCFASLFKHLACLKNGGTSLYRDGQEALVPRSAGMRESGHRRVLKNEFFSTLLRRHHPGLHAKPNCCCAF